ncbi:MAG: hypothetical protein V4488_10720 [Pseudomonadota bacterium]
MSNLSIAQRTQAARSTAETSPQCRAAKPFYWEIGDAGKTLAQGRVGLRAPQSDTLMPIASSSKWVYAAYVAQLRSGKLTDEDIEFLTFRSGYTRFKRCLSSDTVNTCVRTLSNGKQDPATKGKFFYSGGHMQKHAELIGLGDLDNRALAAELRKVLGTEIPVAYNQPQLAGGIVASADSYADFLRKLLAGKLALSGMLGSHAVCTNPATCEQAASTPIPARTSWHYSLGHWVEDDPQTGDGAYSSAGLFGFYPWIDASRSYYGIIARTSLLGTLLSGEGQRPALESAECGRLIRKAWMSGAPQS